MQDVLAHVLLLWLYMCWFVALPACSHTVLCSGIAFAFALASHPGPRDCFASSISCFIHTCVHVGDLTRNPAWTYLTHPPPGTRANRSASNASSLSGTGLLAGGDGGEGGMGAAAGLKAGLGSWVSWMKASVAQFVPPKREMSEDELALRQVGVTSWSLHTLPV